MNKEQIAKLKELADHFIPEARDIVLMAHKELSERTTSPVSQMTDIEKAAEAIYKLIPANTEGAPEDYPWQPGGNSHMQDLARRMARAALAAAAPQAQAPVAEPVIDTAELATELERQWLAKTISDLRQHGYQRLEDGPFRFGWETALDEIEARCGKPADDTTPYPTRPDCEAEALTPAVKEAANTFGAWECPKCGAESSDECPYEFCYVNPDEEPAQPQPVAEQGERASRPENHVVQGRSISDWLWARYTLCNYQPGRISLHNPAPHGGHFCYIEGKIADELGAKYDRWNYDVHQRRAAPAIQQPQAEQVQHSVFGWASFQNGELCQMSWEHATEYPPADGRYTLLAVPDTHDKFSIRMTGEIVVETGCSYLAGDTSGLPG